MKTNYNRTVQACFIGYVVQAIVNNFVPLLFLTFQGSYGISLQKITLLVTFNFGIQLLVDLASIGFVDRIGYRASMILAHAMAAAGLILLTVLPECLGDPFVGLLIAVMIYAIGGGLLEVLVSPVVEACPTDNKEKAMSLLHSFYCWGAVGTILVSTVFFLLFGIGSWKWLAVIFALIPAINIINFATCPIESLVEEGQGMGIRKLFSNPMFLIAIVMMVCSGASELAMAQWASAYAESALGFSKAVGDIAGPCMFAVTMGISRVLFGKAGDKMKLNRFMIGSGILCFVCYLLASFSENPIIGLSGCIVCGFSVGIMWPGTISISSKAFPTGGTAMFALLAMAGDLGGSIGPAIVGRVADMFGGSIHVGMRIGLLFPITLCFMLFLFNIMNHNANKQK